MHKNKVANIFDLDVSHIYTIEKDKIEHFIFLIMYKNIPPLIQH